MSDVKSLPQHVAIIMDGNGRWAKKRGLPRTFGHKNGVKTVQHVIEAADKMGIKYLTLYGFSSENWKRSQDEVSTLMGLLRSYLKSHIADIHKRNGRLRIIGERNRLDDDILQMIEQVERLTATNEGIEVTIALSYGARQEITDGARRLIQLVQEGKLSLEDVTEDTFSQYLQTHGTPDPDLVIRTSGEQRISNFLLWQIAYSEFYFTETLWPDFDQEDLQKAVDCYMNRDRRYGGVKEQSK